MSDVSRFITQDDVQVEELPWGPHEWISREGLTQADHLMLVRVTMPPGKAHKFHRHPHMEEIIYVISGHAEQWVDETAQRLGPGDAAHIPMDVVHGTYNAGDENLVFLAILSPAKSTAPTLVDVSQEEPWIDLRDRPAKYTSEKGARRCRISRQKTKPRFGKRGTRSNATRSSPEQIDSGR